LSKNVLGTLALNVTFAVVWLFARLCVYLYQRFAGDSESNKLTDNSKDTKISSLMDKSEDIKSNELIEVRKVAKINKLLKKATAHAATLHPSKTVEIVTRRVKQPSNRKIEWVAAARGWKDAAGVVKILIRTPAQESKLAALDRLACWLKEDAVEKEMERETLKSAWED
jgi:hypothetical protein